MRNAPNFTWDEVVLTEQDLRPGVAVWTGTKIVSQKIRGHWITTTYPARMLGVCIAGASAGGRAVVRVYGPLPENLS